MMVDASEPMTRSQEVLYDLCFVHGLVPAKTIGYGLHRSANYISDICRRDRVDFMAVFNEALKVADRCAASNPMLMMAIAGPIAGLLVSGTNFQLEHNDAPPPPTATQADYRTLCEQTGSLMEDLGGAVKSIARIECDGVYDESDDADIEECQSKLALLIRRARALSAELDVRRAARSPT